MRKRAWLRQPVISLVLLLPVMLLPAQPPQSTSATGPGAAAGAASAMRIASDMRQLMRAILYPASNVVFSAQTDDPADAKPLPGQDPSMATDPLHSTFGGWEAVENASLALAESANLLLVPGRTCVNGVTAPVEHPDWQKFVQELRDASAAAFRAAQARDQDKMIEVAEAMSVACAHCHRKWREKPAADRCK